MRKLEFETAIKAAERLGVTVRAVQKWAKEGIIPEAHKVGRDWMIPVDFKKTKTKSKTYRKEKRKLTSPSLMLISGYYQVGKCREFIESIKDKDEKNLTMGEYYYFKGDFKSASIMTEPYLNSKNLSHLFTAAIYFAFANLPRKHLHKTQFASGIMRNELEKGFNADTEPEVDALSILSALILRLQLQIPITDTPDLEDYIKYLPDGQRLIACYLLAYKAYLERDYSRSLGIAETAVACCRKDYPMPLIYLYIMQAIDYVNLLKLDKAKKSIEKAWSIAEPDGILLPFVEHYSLLQGMIEVLLKKQNPNYYKLIIDLAKDYNVGWYEVYNEKNKKEVPEHLTPTEFTIAMLYSRGWRAKEISAHMRLSERTVMNYVQIIYEKLNINNKKQLEKYMLT